MELDLKNILYLPNSKHSIKESVITIFLQKPIANINTFSSFFDNNIRGYFNKIETIQHVKYEFSEGSIIEKDKEPRNTGYRLYRVADGNTDFLVQLVNDDNRQFISLHCLNYISWQIFRNDCVTILKILDKWLNNKVTAFSLHYIDILNCKKDIIPLDLIFRTESDLLPRGFFSSQNSFLVFNSEKDTDNSKYQHFDRIELKVQSKLIAISHNSIIRVGRHNSFSSFFNCDVCSDKLNWAHDHNKKLLKDILSKEVQKLIGLI